MKDQDFMKDQLVKALNLPNEATWADIFVEIGKLKERAKNQSEYTFTYPDFQSETPYHYHNGMKCYNNPCTWC